MQLTASISTIALHIEDEQLKNTNKFELKIFTRSTRDWKRVETRLPGPGAREVCVHVKPLISKNSRVLTLLSSGVLVARVVFSFLNDTNYNICPGYILRANEQ